MALALVGGAVTGALAYTKVDDRKLLKAFLAGAGATIFIGLKQLLSRSVFGLKRELSPNEEWVQQYEEPAYEPELAILDCHHHLWDPATHDKGWPVSKLVLKIMFLLKPSVVNRLVCDEPWKANSFGSRIPLACPYMGKDLSDDIRGRDGQGHNVVGTVYMECGWKTPGVERCMEPVGEADMVVQVNKEFPSLCNAMVCHAELSLGKEVEPALQHYQKNPMVKGIRVAMPYANGDPMVHGEGDGKLAYDPKFREGFALLSKYGLSFDSWGHHTAIDGWASLAEAFPETTIIVDHCCGFALGIGSFKIEESMVQWRASVKNIARFKNVYCKVGGTGMRWSGHGFDERPKPATSDELAQAWGPMVSYCIEHFGVDRCMMESNFPMDKITCSYNVYFNAMKKIVKDFSKEDKKKLFEMNARRVYKLGGI